MVPRARSEQASQPMWPPLAVDSLEVPLPTDRGTPMTSTRHETTPTELEQVRLPVQARLAAAWTSFMFLYIYVDYLALYKPGFLDDLLAGRVHEFDTGPTFVALAITLMAVPIAMILLSVVLPARSNRAANLVVAAIYVPVTIFNAAGEPASYAYFYAFSIGVELVLLAYIARSAWAWPRRAV